MDPREEADEEGPNDPWDLQGDEAGHSISKSDSSLATRSGSCARGPISSLGGGPAPRSHGTAVSGELFIHSPTSGLRLLSSRNTMGSAVSRCCSPPPPPELNFIEQCWGCATWDYCKPPLVKGGFETLKGMPALKSLDGIPLQLTRQ